VAFASACATIKNSTLGIYKVFYGSLSLCCNTLPMQMPLWVFPRFLKANLHRQSVKAQGTKISTATVAFAGVFTNANATFGISLVS